jgi:hypothetical protein
MFLPGACCVCTLSELMLFNLFTFSSLQGEQTSAGSFFGFNLFIYINGLRDCQMVYFQTKIPIWENIRRAIDWKMFLYFMAIWNILRTFGTSSDHLEHFVLLYVV